MSPLFPPEEGIPMNTTAMAIDKDKNSQHAVGWAIDHLVISHPLILLIHVRHKSNQHQSTSDAETGETDAQQLFIPYRGYCARKGVQMKEILLDDTDFPRALVDYVHKNGINNFVAGSSARSTIASVIKAAPEFFSVNVISKGKIISARATLRPVANTAMPPRLPSQPHFQPDSHELENGAK